MKAERFKTFFFTIVIGIVSFSCSSSKVSNKKKPNIVIILADDLGYGDISCYAQTNYSTPEIDKIASEGVKCTDFYVPTPYCAPSRATLLTGRFPLRHKLILNPTPDGESEQSDTIGLAYNEITLGEVLQKAGYTTKLIGKWHLGHKEKFFPVNHGFDEYYGILYSNDMRPVQIIENKDTVEYPVDQNLLTQKYTAKALEFITRNKENPFFLHFCHSMPHKPLAASEGFYTPETKNDLYSDVIRELDWSVGEVVKKLNELNLLENTILIFMSDNGPFLGGSTGGLKGMKATSWEGGIRVPFMIRYPKAFEKGKEINTPCWSPDVFPTLLSLAGITADTLNYLDGSDITDVLKGKQTNHAPIFSMHNDKIIAIRKGNYKLFVEKSRYKPRPMDWVDPRAPDGKTIIAPLEQAGPEQYPGIMPQKPKKKILLFDLKNDITESNDLSEKKPEIVEDILKDYENFKLSLSNKNETPFK